VVIGGLIGGKSLVIVLLFAWPMALLGGAVAFAIVLALPKVEDDGYDPVRLRDSLSSLQHRRKKRKHPLPQDAGEGGGPSHRAALEVDDEPIHLEILAVPEEAPPLPTTSFTTAPVSLPSRDEVSTRSEEQIPEAISAQCMNPDCMAEFEADGALAGRETRCPQCGAPVLLPRPSPVPRRAPAAPVLEVEQAPVAIRVAPRLCPSCNSEMPGDAVLCLSCGFDHRLGRQRAQVRSKKKSQADIPLRGARQLALIGVPFGGLVLLILTLIFAKIHPILGTMVFLLGATLIVFLAVLAFVITAKVLVCQEGEDDSRCSIHYQVLGMPVHRRRFPLSRYHRLVWFHETPAEAVFVMLALVCVGIIPGILWWVLILSKRSFLRVEDTVTGHVQRFSVLWGESSLRELIDTIQEVQLLPLDRA
jgi:hypothetical protein